MAKVSEKRLEELKRTEQAAPPKHRTGEQDEEATRMRKGR